MKENKLKEILFSIAIGDAKTLFFNGEKANVYRDEADKFTIVFGNRANVVRSINGKLVQVGSTWI